MTDHRPAEQQLPERDVPRYGEMIHWIRCSDLLPDPDESVLVWVPSAADGRVWIGFHDGKQWVHMDWLMPFEPGDVYAWSELPYGNVP